MAAIPDVEATTSSSSGSRSARGESRFRALQEAHFELVWRSLRRLGVPEADVDDALQQVFLVASQRLDTITPGKERAFLFGTAMRVASHTRRTLSRRPEVLDDDSDAHVDRSASIEDAIDQRRARAMLDRVLDALPIDVRAVFVLFELEGMTIAEIASMLELPMGTAASRLRRGRELFSAEVAREQARTQRRSR